MTTQQVEDASVDVQSNQHDSFDQGNDRNTLGGYVEGDDMQARFEIANELMSVAFGRYPDGRAKWNGEDLRAAHKIVAAALSTVQPRLDAAEGLAEALEWHHKAGAGDRSYRMSGSGLYGLTEQALTKWKQLGLSDNPNDN